MKNEHIGSVTHFLSLYSSETSNDRFLLIQELSLPTVFDDESITVYLFHISLSKSRSLIFQVSVHDHGGRTTNSLVLSQEIPGPLPLMSTMILWDPNWGPHYKVNLRHVTHEFF